MPNMSYCMFKNTAQAVRMCEERLEQIQFNFDDLPEDEQQVAIKFVAICKYVAENYLTDIKL